MKRDSAIEETTEAEMTLRVACVVVVLSCLAAAVTPVQASYSICPGVGPLTPPTVWSDENCTLPLAGSLYEDPDTMHAFWIGGGNWVEVNVTCEGLGSDWAPHQRDDGAEYFSFGLYDDAIHQCEAKFDASYGSTQYAPIRWSVRRNAHAGQEIHCQQENPLSFACSLTDAGQAVPNTPLFYKISLLVDGVPRNAFDVMLDGHYRMNDLPKVGLPDLIAGFTDSAGNSRIQLYLNFAKMSDQLGRNLFPSEQQPSILSVTASTEPDSSGAVTVFSVSLNHSKRPVSTVFRREG